MIESCAQLFGAWVQRVDRSTLRADALAGILGALLVLPQGVAFATLAGLPPEYGLATAIVPCIVAALFGSSWQMASGPTNTNSLALLATLAPLAAVGSPQYVQLALAVTVLVGVMQWTLGFFKLGALANFISPAALHGFTSGAAVLIAVHSLTDLLGLARPAAHGSGAVLVHVAEHLSAIRPAALAVGLGTLLLVLALRRFAPRWPAMLIALGVATAASAAWNGIQPWPPGGAVAVLGSLPAIWPTFHWPAVQWRTVPDLLSIALALTIVALSQSISVAKAVAARSGQAIDTNREFRGQGLSNIVGGFMSSYVSCGSLNRSMPNLEAGARTPLAAVFAALWLLALLAFTSPLLGLIPMPAIAGVLLPIAWSLMDWAGWRRLWRFSRPDAAIAGVTLLATVTIRLEVAILLGTTLSLLVYLYRTSRPSMRVMHVDTASPKRAFAVVGEGSSAPAECPQLKLMRMEGEVYFGAVAHVADQLRELRQEASSSSSSSSEPSPPRHLLVMAKSMNFIDLAAADLWRSELQARRALGGDLYFHRPRSQVLALWQRTGFTDQLGPQHIFPDKRSAIAAIFERLDRRICARCTARVFVECGSLAPPASPPVTVMN